MFRKTTLIVCCCILAAAAAGAQGSAETVERAWDDGQRVEFTLFLGLLLSDSLASIGPGAKLDFDEDLDLGFTLSLPTPYEGFQAELIVSRNKMELTADRPGQPRLATIEQQFIHIGGLWELGEGRNRGFATASAGIVQLDPDGSFYSHKTLPSVGLGGGYKFFVSDHVAFRLEGRLLGHVGAGRIFCNSTAGCLGQVSSSMLVQFQAAAGLTVRF